MNFDPFFHSDLLNNDNSHIKAESTKTQNLLDVTKEKLTSVETALSAFKSAVASRDETIKQSDIKIVEQQAELKTLKETVRSLESNVATLMEENAIFKSTEDDRRQNYETKAATLNAITTQVKSEREAEKQKNQVWRWQYF